MTRAASSVAMLLTGVLGVSPAYIEAAEESFDDSAPRIAAQTWGDPQAIPDDREYRRRGAVVRVGGSVTVDEDEVIEHDVIAVLGSVNVQGRVRGNVVSVGGNIVLGPEADIGRDVTTVGGRIVADPQARISGQTIEVSMLMPFFHVRSTGEDAYAVTVAPDWPLIARATLMLRGLRWLFVALLVVGAIIVARPRVEQVEAAWRDSPLAALLMGVVIAALIGPAAALLVMVLSASIVGIPLVLLVPALLFMVGVFWLLGFAAISIRIGARFVGAERPVASALVGLMLLWAPAIVGTIIWAAEPRWWIPAWGLMSIALLAEAVAWSAGLGAMVMSWLNRPVQPRPVETATSAPTA